MFINIKVIPNAGRNEIIQKTKGEFTVKVTATAQRGKANKKVLTLLADYFHVPKSGIAIVKGAYNSRKVVHIVR